MQAHGLGMIPLPKTGEAPHKGRSYEPVYLLVVVLVDRVESLLDLLVGPRLVAVDGLGVEAEQDRDAVTRSARDLGRGDAGLGDAGSADFASD
ncbi:hypothetical protein ACFWA5_38175 [Streptomyces mirabilis]|uniref:hypothetical protein n=1 Tax=Streptomyces mirabilis TaxID=68239 RepID=UPI003646BF17